MGVRENENNAEYGKWNYAESEILIRSTVNRQSCHRSSQPSTANLMEKRWKIKTPDEQKSKILAEALKIHPMISRILVGRGIENFDEAKTLFSP